MNSPRVVKREGRYSEAITKLWRTVRATVGLPSCSWFVVGLALVLAPCGHAQTLQRRDGTDVANLNDTSPPNASAPASNGTSVSTTTTGTRPGNAGAKPTAAASSLPPSVADELEAMKKRIEELEAQLKIRASEKPATDAAAPAPNAATPNANAAAPVLGAAAPSAKVASASDAAAAGPNAYANTSGLSYDPGESTSTSANASVSTEGTDDLNDGGSTPAPNKSFMNALRNIVGFPQTQGGAPVPVKDVDPFSLYDYTWMNASSRNEDEPLAVKYFTPEFRADTMYAIDGNHPSDHTLGGSTEEFESGEVQVEQLSFGGDLRVGNVRGRVLTMFGNWAATTPRNDVSPSTSSWDLDTAYRYVSEAWGGYHFNINHTGGLNVDAGIFVSYIGLFSYYNFDNWAYQPSYVSSNTPWFFNGVRIQYFPTAKLKIEPWFINGWQSYAKSNGDPGLGGQILWRPTGWFSLVTNNYGFGHDNPNILAEPSNVPVFQGSTTGQSRIHTDNSVEFKLYDKPKNYFDKFAFSFTADAGCQSGGTGIFAASCAGENHIPKDYFLGLMEYDRFWFHKDLFAITLGGGVMTNPGRYLTLLPPIDAATAITGTPYFTENPGQTAKMWDTTFTFDYMPAQFLTFRWEAGYRFSNVPYFTGPGGITPPGGDNGSPQFYTCANGTTSGTSTLGPGSGSAEAVCSGLTGLSNAKSVWFPSLVQGEMIGTMAILVKF